MDPISLIIAIVVGLLIFGVALNSYLRGLKINNFTDKYILITGCDTGIGNSAAKTLDAMGFHIFAGCLHSDKGIELASVCSDRLVPLTMDVTKEESVQRALAVVKEVLPTGAGLWALVNNAGVMGPVGLCQWLSKAEFEEPINVNLLGTVCVTTAFLPLVRRAKGRIVVASSVVGRLGTFPAPYSVSKYCVEGYTDWLRFQLLPQGITVHTMEPGGHNSSITSTEMNIASMEKVYASLSDDMKEFYGDGVKDRLAQILTLTGKFYRFFNVDSAADRYVHAVSALYPKIRYVFGLDAHFLFRPLWMMPTCISDFLIGSFYPLPQKCY